MKPHPFRRPLNAATIAAHSLAVDDVTGAVAWFREFGKQNAAAAEIVWQKMRRPERLRAALKSAGL
jgi:hypothetical protein